MNQEGVLFPVRDALMYIQSTPLGGRGKASQGESFYTADNPPFGATFTYYLKETLKNKKTRRQESEKALEKLDSVLTLPTVEDLRA
jgi:hypothetical protein